MAWILAREQVRRALANVIQSKEEENDLFLLLVKLAFLFLGFILEGVPALILLFKSSFPVAPF